MAVMPRSALERWSTCRARLTLLHTVRDGPYLFLVPPSYKRLEDFRVHSMNLGAECGNCGHRGVVDGPKVWRWFALHRWEGALERVGEHMRCSVCRRRPTNLAPTPAEPSIDFGPQSEAEWKAVVARLRR